MKKLILEIRKSIGQWMIGKAFDILPNGEFKKQLALFIANNLKQL